MFVRNGTTWSQQAFLKQSTNSGTGTGDRFGASVTISGDTIAVGAPFEDSDSTGINGDELNINAPSSGAVYIFGRVGTTWTQEAYVKGLIAETNDSFGGSVSLDGLTLAVTASGDDSNGLDPFNNFVQGSGAAYVFVQDPVDLTWSQQAFLKASNPSQRDTFGRTIGLSGDTIVISANSEDSDSVGVNGTMNDDGDGSGAAYIFKRSGTSWAETDFLKASNSTTFFAFGSAVAISGDLIAVSAVGDDSGSPGVNGDQFDTSQPSAGAAYVFVDAEMDFEVGDVNCDGAIDFADIGPFITALSSPDFTSKADIDGNGVVNFADIAPFIALLAGS